MKAIVFDNKLKFTDTYPMPEPMENEALDKAKEAFERATAKDALKVIIDFR